MSFLIFVFIHYAHMYVNIQVKLTAVRKFIFSCFIL
jgi:hypothetical protein